MASSFNLHCCWWVIGYVYYRLVGCPTGGCIITSNPYISTAYMALLGFLLSGAFEKESVD